MKRLHIVIPLTLLFCFIFGCQTDEKNSEEIVSDEFEYHTAAGVIRDAFMSNEDDNIEIVEFSLESEDIALVESKFNGYHLSSRVINSETGWILNEIQNTEGDWTPAEHFLKIEGKIRYANRPFANEMVTLYEVIEEEGA